MNDEAPCERESVERLSTPVPAMLIQFNQAIDCVAQAYLEGDYQQKNLLLGQALEMIYGEDWLTQILWYPMPKY